MECARQDRHSSSQRTGDWMTLIRGMLDTLGRAKVRRMARIAETT